MIDVHDPETRAPQPDPEPDTPRMSAQRRRDRRLYSKHGLTALRAAVRTLGPRVLDQRTTLGKQLAGWKADLMRDLGGHPSTAQLAVIDLARAVAVAKREGPEGPPTPADAVSSQTRDVLSPARRAYSSAGMP